MQIEIPSEIKYIREVSSKILDSLISYKVDEDKLFDIRLCAEEALRNAIVHGNRMSKQLHVRVDYRVDKGIISIEVEDEGAGYDPNSILDPTLNENITRESGRGVCLIKKLMDKVDFNKKGNKIRMEKRLWS